MSAPHKLFLGFGVAVIVVLFFVATRPPSDAELEYRLVAPPASVPPSASWPARAKIDEAPAPPPSDHPRAGDPSKRAGAPHRPR